MRLRLILPLVAATITYSQTITNFAGTGTAGFAGDGGPATSGQVNRVVGLAADAAGNIYFADQNNNRIRKVDTHGTLTTFAGTFSAGFSGDGGPATSAQLNGPTGVCVSASGDVYINDLTNHRVRKVAAGTGIITTVAGNGSAVASGDGVAATSAGMFLPIRCAVDGSGNLFIVDQGAHNIRKVNTGGIITTFAGITNTANFFGDNGPATQAAMNNPTAASFDGSGNLYVTDQSNQRIRKIDTNGIITTVAGNGNVAFSGDGGLATSASLNFPGETVIDSAGTLFILDTVNEVIRKVSGGIITTVAGTPGVIGNIGDGGPPLQAQFNFAFPITLDSSGNLYVGDTNNNRVRKISGLAAAPQPCTYSLSPGGQAFPAAGGAGTINVTAPAGCPWSLTNAPIWITGATSGSGTGVLTYQALTNVGPARSGTLTVAGQTFSVEQAAASIPGLNLIGSMAHLAAQENWTTAFTLVNKGSASATARLSFFGDPGDPTGTGPLPLPLVFPQQTAGGGSLLAASLDRTIGANASLVVNTTGPQTPPVQIGSAQLFGTGAVDGFAIFHQIVTAQEAVVPMETRNANSYLLAFDNTGGVVLGVAVENVSAQAGNIGVVIRDDAGVPIGTDSISMPANGHTSFVVSQQYGITANKRGTIEFDIPVGRQISVLGIRFTPPNNALTTIPALANVGTNGGSIAHLATGNGWQTTFVLVNTGSTAAPVHLKFFADVTGSPLSIPLSFPQSGAGTTTTANSVDRTLAAGETLIVQSAAPLSDPTPTTGAAQLTTTGNVGGFVIFRFNPNGQEAVVPLESRTASGFLIAFDNTAGTGTGIAVNNNSSQAVSVPVIVRDDNGSQIATDTLNMAANAHLAFTLVLDKYPGTANKRGTIEFDTPPGGQIGALGIRIPVAHTFTTLPALAK